MAKPSSNQAQAPQFSGQERFCVFCGKEEYLKQQYFNQLLDKLKDAHDDNIEVIRHDGLQAELADILDDVRSIGLMMQYKVVVVDNATASGPGGSSSFVAKHRAALERYADDPVDHATLVLKCEVWNKGKLDKRIEKIGSIAKCDAVSEKAAMNWLGRRCTTRYARELQPAAAQLLIERLGTDLSRLDGELSKVALSGSAEVPITPDDVLELVGKTSEESAWEIQSALLSGDAGKAVAKLNELYGLAGQPRELLTFFIVELLKKLSSGAMMLAAGVPEGEINREMKVWGDRVRPFQAAMRKLGVPGAARLQAKMIEIDRRSKSGFEAYDSIRGLERFCVEFVTALKARR